MTTPKLYAQWRNESQLYLRRVPSSAGHVLISFLYSGRYECPEPKGSTPYDREVDRFKTSVWVYKLARDYELPELESLAKYAIEKIGIYLNATRNFDVLGEIFPRLGENDEFLQAYLKTLLRPFIERRVTSLGSWSDSAGKNPSFTNAILRLINQLLCDTGDRDIRQDVNHNELKSPTARAKTPSKLHQDDTPTTASPPAPGRGGFDITPMDVNIRKGIFQKPENTKTVKTERCYIPNIDELESLKGQIFRSNRHSIANWAAPTLVYK
ncbi:hypothetical protein RRF57_013169 [Xylaria bambusicola]|uniref:BTB domain-containing protein n=1 Tax=Xylaria bambusicola TaxID=326684 RepID=A0AAN7V504_9PEZI